MALLRTTRSIWVLALIALACSSVLVDAGFLERLRERHLGRFRVDPVISSDVKEKLAQNKRVMTDIKVTNLSRLNEFAQLLLDPSPGRRTLPKDMTDAVFWADETASYCSKAYDQAVIELKLYGKVQPTSDGLVEIVGDKRTKLDSECSKYVQEYLDKASGSAQKTLICKMLFQIEFKFLSPQVEKHCGNQDALFHSKQEQLAMHAQLLAIDAALSGQTGEQTAAPSLSEPAANLVARLQDTAATKMGMECKRELQRLLRFETNRARIVRSERTDDPIARVARKVDSCIGGKQM